MVEDNETVRMKIFPKKGCGQVAYHVSTDRVPLWQHATATQYPYTDHSTWIPQTNYTMYNVIHGHSHFPSGLFAHSNFPYSSNRSLNFTRPFARANYLFHSFVPSVIGLWNNLPHSLKAMPSIST